MPIRILSVIPGSPADRAGLQAEDGIVQINSEDVLDEIDFQALTAVSRLNLTIQKKNGELRHLLLHKKSWEPLGICLDETKQMKPRSCRNHCLFCFVDQLPRGMRSTLYVKDDDWRLSLMMGNYVTLTNVDDSEFGRILRRKASPLYISVHATDPDVRVRMLRNPSAANLMPRLRMLAEAGLEFHGQVVLCPGINDGEILNRTIRDLSSLWPSSRSLAIVPVGMTRHRGNLPCLRAFDPASAASLLDQVRPFQEQFLAEFGTRFVFPSDEFYCISSRPLPGNDEYEDYSQIENGVGMLRQLEQECAEAASDDAEAASGSSETADPFDFSVPAAEKPASPVFFRRHLLIPTGVSAQPFIQALAQRYAPADTRVDVIAVKNRFFGESITVTGLIVGQDLVHGLQGLPCDEILISSTMLREQTDCFLDDMTLKEVEARLKHPVHVVENTGESLIRALRGDPDF